MNRNPNNEMKSNKSSIFEKNKNKNELKRINGDEKWDYFSFIAFMIGGFSLSGIVFSGLPAKELLLLNQCDNGIIIVSLISASEFSPSPLNLCKIFG